MKRVPLLITAGIVALIVAGYFGYDALKGRDSLKPWDVVPDDAFLVYEKEGCSDCLNALTNSTLWEVIEKAALYKKDNDSIRHKINSVLKNEAGALVSAHVTKKDDFDFIFFFPKRVLSERSLFNDKSYRTTSREFNAITIHELSKGRQTFSYSTIDDVWVGSFTPFLVEDAIRTYTNRKKTGFTNRWLNELSFATIKDDAGNLYVQLEAFKEWISIFMLPSDDFANPLARRSLLDIKSTENSTILNGFSSHRANNAQYTLSAFYHQAPVSFGLKHLISNRTVLLTSYGVSDGKRFSQDLKQFVTQKKPVFSDTLRLLAQRLPGVAGLTDLIADEFAVAFLESAKGRGTSKILMVETAETKQWLDTFAQLANKLSVDTVFYEKFAQYEIGEVPLRRFPEKLLWPFVKDFEQSFYTSLGDVIFISENLEDLKEFLDDIETEDTWGKSVSQNRFLETTLLESNVSVYFNASKVWNLLLPKLQPRWQSFVRENKTLLQSLQMSSLQFSHLNNNFYTNIVFTYKPYDPSPHQDNRERSLTNFSQPVQSLHAVRSHVNRSNELLIQDSLNDLSLVSAEGKVLWKLPIGDRILGDVRQVDFYNNGKLQYFFATYNALHIIDRLGNYVENYPIKLQGVEIDYASVVDYDNSKKYRFLLADKSGKLWMYDKNGTNLDGWKAKDAGGELSCAPRHHRIKGKDFIVAVRKDGFVLVMNRRGENLNRFPLNTESIPRGDYYLDIGNAIDDSYFVIVSQDGYRIKFNTSGKIQSRETLLKTSVASAFSLVNEKSHKSYLVLQQDSRQINLTDVEGKKIIASNLTGITPADINYYDFGAGKVFIGINDRAQGLCYIYDGLGNLLSAPPIEASSFEIRPANGDQFYVFFIHDRSLAIQPL